MTKEKKNTLFGKYTSWLVCYLGEEQQDYMWWGTALVKNDWQANSEMWERDKLKELSAGKMCLHIENSLLP